MSLVNGKSSGLFCQLVLIERSANADTLCAILWHVSAYSLNLCHIIVFGL